MTVGVDRRQENPKAMIEVNLIMSAPFQPLLQCNWQSLGSEKGMITALTLEEI